MINVASSNFLASPRPQLFNLKKGRARRFRAICAALTCGVAVLAMPGLANADIALKFGVYAADKPSETVRKFRPMLNVLEAELSRQLGEPVTIHTQISSGYDKAIENLTNGDIDFARFGPASYITAKQKNAGVSILAVESVKGGKFFRGIICVAENSPVVSLGELKGRSFAFGNRLSTIGRYLAQQVLLDAGITSSDLSKFDYLSRHDIVGTAVGLGRFHAGALKESTFNKLRKKGVPIRKLVSFRNVTKPWLARPGLAQPMVEAIRSALLRIKDKKALKAIKKSGFLEASDSDFDAIRLAISRSQKFGG